ncbi:protocadherin-12 [Ambystoma mexicanum]|uniref:protocadherin-12 n=1 Tax=Ambystoma mexicanum TaxID=8296 RepID=UPI0037E6FD4D
MKMSLSAKDLLWGAFVLVLMPWSGLLVDGEEGTSFTKRYTVYEEVPMGTTIGTLPQDLGWKERPDEEFKLMRLPGLLHVQVGSTDGSIFTTGRLDREQLCHLQHSCLVSFDVLATKALALIHVEIEVLDVNDHQPQFPKAEVELEISESAALQTRIPLDRAWDPDCGANALQEYSLSPSEHFALDVISSSDSTKHAELVVIKELDRELQSSFKLVLTALDHGVPGKSGTTLIRIHVLDSNDNSPVFAESSLSLEISENALPGTLLINVTATDPDQGPNGEVEYSFSKHVPSTVLDTFSLDPKTGSIALNGPLDYEERRVYEVDVQARDLGPNPIPAHCKVLIKVLDVNDNSPQIHVTWASQHSHVPLVSEALPKDSFVALITASDPDAGENGQVECQLQQDHGHFRLKRTNGNSYILLTNSSLDRERLAEYNLTVHAQDKGDPPCSATKDLTIHISDANDNSPLFDKNAYQASVAENNPPRTHLLTISAKDADIGPNGRITFSIPDSVAWGSHISRWVSVDPTTGEVFALKPLDFEMGARLEFMVRAEDGGQPSLSSTVPVMINLQDENDNHPVVVQPVLKGGKASITVMVNPESGLLLTSAEKASHSRTGYFTAVTNVLAEAEMIPDIGSNSYPILNIMASDADSGLNGALVYHILKGNEAGLFHLDRRLGQVYLNMSNASSLIGRSCELTIQVEDQGDPSLHTQALLTFTFSNHLEHLRNSAESGKLSPSVVTVICLAVLLAVFLLILVLLMSICRTDRKESQAYNCREAESTYRQQPKRPQRQIQKADILLVPALRSQQEEQSNSVECPPGNEALSREVGTEVPGDSPLQTPFHLTPTLYRTLRNQVNQEAFDSNQENLDPFNFPSSAYRTLQYQRQRAASRENLAPQETLRSSPKILTNPGSPQVRLEGEQSLEPVVSDGALLVPGSGATLRRQKNTDARARAERDPRQQIMRSLVRLSMAALAERERVELTMDSPHVQQISQLLSLLHQGQVHPRPNHRGNKYTTKSPRSATQEADWMSTKDSGHGESEAGDLESEAGGDLASSHLLLEDGLEGLMDPADGYEADHIGEPDPALLARLSLPMTADYKANLFTPATASIPEDEPILAGSMERDELKTFLTFGKAEPEPGDDPKLAGNFLSEMSSLFEMLLTQKADAHAATASEVLLRLSACSRTLGLDIGTSVVVENELAVPGETLSSIGRTGVPEWTCE